MSKTESLNSICDVARANETLRTSMGVSVPRRNTLSNANAVRPSAMAKDLYLKTVSHLVGIAPKSGKGPHRGYCFRIKTPTFVVDSSTVRLTTDSFDWARHRREKAAAKLHLTFDLGSRLPSFAIVEDAAHHDSVRAAELTAHLKAGDVAVADLGLHRLRLHERPRRARRLVRHPAEAQHEDGGRETAHGLRPADFEEDDADPRGRDRRAREEVHRRQVRRVTAMVEMQGRTKTMAFLTNGLKWSARTVAETCRDKWGIEMFFKELKQTCQIHDFIGYSENAVQWQVWTRLLAHLLLRYLAYLSKWGLSFSRLAALVRGILWNRRRLVETLRLYGTAGLVKSPSARPKRLVFQLVFDFAPAGMGQQTR